MDNSDNKMLIDATHPEETRVVVLKDNRVEEFDYESANKQQLRGNIYLAKVTRVEPSLQAAFVDYGGNRHGFLAFNEIHPDYYQIPTADREMLLEQEAEDAQREALEDDGSSDVATDDVDEDDRDDDEAQDADDDIDDDQDDGDDAVTDDDDVAASDTDDDDADDIDRAVKASVDEVGNEDALEEVPERKRRRRARHYKIQEVIRRRQILLVQVVKEERGNKGAALTTYLSLAGRHTVLMPNTARGGGISRKITNASDRSRLRKIAAELDVQEGMGLIIRTAGASRTKQEIKRDYDYLLRLWENVREKTLESIAPTLVHEEGDLIKRSIRDLYSKEIDEVLVAGESAHKEAKRFMKMLMPSHAKHVKAYKDPDPLFARFRIETQLNEMFSPFVTLPSGGYIVINQTEALVAVDVNSGKATREHSIEATALKTNLEAATELSRQLKLRDLAGLIVIDFIDMDERRNNRAVERRLKDCLKTDRARIQVGRISPFGLLEMSRQRMRTGVLEGSTSQCPACQGTGMIRSTESVSLSLLRALEDTLRGNSGHALVARCSTEVALFILNSKRDYVSDMEERYGVSVVVTGDDTIHGANYSIEAEQTGGRGGEQVLVQVDWGAQQPAAGSPAESGGKRKRRRRRRKGGGDEVEARSMEPADGEELNDDDEDASDKANAASDDRGEEPQGERKRRRRGRRGGRNNRRRRGEEASDDATVRADEDADRGDADDDGKGDAPVEARDGADDEGQKRERGGRGRSRGRRRGGRGRSTAEADANGEADAEADERTAANGRDVNGHAVEADADYGAGEDKPKRRRRRSRDRTDNATTDAPAQADAEKTPERAAAAVDAQPDAADDKKAERSASRRRWLRRAKDDEAVDPVVSSTVDDNKDDSAAKSSKKGWWQRRIGG